MKTNLVAGGACLFGRAFFAWALAVALLFGAHALRAQNTTIVSFGGDYTSSSNVFLRGTNPSAVTADLDGDGFSDDSSVTYAFSSTTALSPTANYTGPIFYGGVRGAVLNATGLSFGERQVVNNTTTNDAIGVRYQPATGVNGQFHMALYFDKAQFLNGGSTATAIRFTTGSSITIDTPRFENLGTVRWLVRNGTQFYVSAATVASNGSLTFASATDDGQWAAYNPATALNFDAASATFATQDFQNITAIGLLVDKDAFTSVRHWLQVRGFTASVQVITGLPTASINATPTSGAVPLAVSFNGSASTAPAGASLTSYAWNFGDGNTATGASPAHTFTAPGSYNTSLTVTDSFGQTDTKQVTITVTNTAPTASFTATPTSGNAPLAVAFNAAASSDPENHALTYAWNFGDGSTGKGIAPNKTYSAAGTYNVSLVVTDAYGAESAAATTTITALNANQAPTASFTVTPSTGSIPLLVNVDAAASSDPDGSIASYSWNFGDGGTATGATAARTYTTAGLYTITLTVTDNNGATASTTRTIGATDGASAVIVNFSGEMVTASQSFRNANPTTTSVDLDGDGAADDSFSQYAFSSTSRLSPTTGYTGVPFYGGVRGETLNEVRQLGERSVVNSAASDVFGVRHQPATGLTGRLHLVFYVDKADFLAGGATSPVKFDYLSRFRMTNGRFENLGDVRWLVRDGTQFYVSETLASSGGTLTFANNNDDGRWAAFDPAASLNFDASSASFAPRNFTDITGVGLITDKDAFSSVRHWLQFSLFEVTAFVGAGNGTANLPPTASFTATPNPVKRPNAVAFNSSASSDPEGGTLTRAWNFGDGNTSTATSPSHVYAAPGTYTASLTVTDSFGNNSAAVTRAITVLTPNVAPVASISATPTQGEAPLAVSLSGAASSDSDGSIVSYVWNFGDGTTATGTSASKTYSIGGEYVVSLTVTDNDGATHTTTAVVRALVNGNVPPTAAFTATPANGIAPLAVGVNASASSDPDGTIVSYAWDFGDGTTASGVTASKTYAVPGTYTITLLVTDNSGGVRSTTRNIIALDPANAGPTDNPVATKYGPTAYPWTNQINWTNVFNVTTFAGANDLERYNAARDAAVAAGGGVVYFPAGTYTFTSDLYLANGVVIRGETPSNTDAKSAGFSPPTKFEFPQYIPSFTGSGTPTSTAFKQIFTTTGNTDSNLGLVYIDVNRARINLQGDKDTGTNRNYVIFGVRSNNVALADGSIPKTTYQHAWQVWPNRFATNISVTVNENALVANNRINDAITDDFEMPGYIVEDTSKPVGDPLRFIALPGSQAKFEYAAHYGIYVNRGSSVTYGTPATAPSLFRTGIVIRDNYVYATNRVKIHAAGQGLVIQDNILRDDPNKARWISPTGDRLVQNAATLENRGIDFSGHQVQIVGNDIQVFRHRLKEGPYYSVDGEGILHQECCGGSSIRGVLIEDNIVNSYIGLYKSREIEDATIRGNLITNGTGALTDLIYVNADTNSTAYYVKNVLIENNTLQSGNNIRLEGDGAGGGTGNVIRNNTSTGSGTINVSNAANATTSNNTGFTVVPF